MDTGWAVALGGVVTAIITALGAWIINLIKTRADIKKTSRADAIAEWVNLSVRQDTDIKRLQERCDISEQEQARLRESERNCLQKFSESEVKIATQSGVIDRLTADVRRLQAKTGDTHPAVTLPLVITASVDDGIVRNANASIGPMLNWKPDSSADGIVGKSIEVLIPERLRPLHRKGLQEVREGKREVDPAKPLHAKALRADGKEIEVTIYLSMWKSPAGSRLLTAEIREAESAVDVAVKATKENTNA